MLVQGHIDGRKEYPEMLSSYWFYLKNKHWMAFFLAWTIKILLTLASTFESSNIQMLNKVEYVSSTTDIDKMD